MVGKVVVKVFVLVCKFVKCYVLWKIVGLVL